MGRKPIRKPVTAQLETQARLTLALLPLVSGLPCFDDEAIARVFGQAMATLNWIRPIARRFPPFLEIELPKIESEARQPRTQEEQRALWREYQREYRRRKKEVRP